MTPQQIANEVLHHWWLLWPLPAAERIKLIDEIFADLVFEEQLRIVRCEMSPDSGLLPQEVGDLE